MIINEQVKELRNLAEYGSTFENVKNRLLEAADTIEALSAKLENMEQSEDCGGWIPCSKRLPNKNGYCLVTMRNKYEQDFLMIDTVDYIDGWDIGDMVSEDFEIIAWQPLPEPYHEP